MSSNNDPQRRMLLALQDAVSMAPTALTVQTPAGGSAEARRKLALSVPECILVRTLAEPLEAFFEACGGRQTISLSVHRLDDASPPETSGFQQPFVIIGRCQESDLALADGNVNFRHYYLQFVGGRWVFVNLTDVAGQSADNGKSPWGWFEVGCELTAGPYSITRVAVGSESSSRRPADGRYESVRDHDAFELELVHSGEGSQGDRGAREPPTLRISTLVALIGSSRLCDVWLKDDSVSKVHASLVSTPNGLWVVDLLGRQGVLVDGRPVHWQQVREGSVLQIGRFHLRVRFSDSGKLGGRRRLVPVAPEKAVISEPASSSGSLSERAAMTLVGQMAEMQTQFFEHSRLQMQLITELLAQLGRTQQESVRKDLARIDEIGRELQDIKSQMDSSTETAPRSLAPKKTKRARTTAQRPTGNLPHDMPSKDRPVDQTLATPQSPAAETSAPGGSQAGVAGPPPSVAPQVQDTASTVEIRSNDRDRVPDAGRDGGAPTVDHQVRIMQRLAALTQERTSRWRHVLNVFAGKPQSRMDD